MEKNTYSQMLILLPVLLLLSACSSIPHSGQTKADNYTLAEAQRPLVSYFKQAYHCPTESLKLNTTITGPFIDFDTHKESGTQEIWTVHGCGKSETMRVIVEPRTWYGLQDYTIHLSIDPSLLNK